MLIKCKVFKKTIEIPFQADIKKGDKLQCPKSCTMYKYCGGNLNVLEVWSPKVTVNGCLKYSDEEITALKNKLEVGAKGNNDALANKPSASVNNENTTSKPSESTRGNTASRYAVPSQSESNNSASRYSIPSQSASNNGASKYTVPSKSESSTEKPNAPSNFASGSYFGYSTTNASSKNNSGVSRYSMPNQNASNSGVSRYTIPTQQTSNTGAIPSTNNAVQNSEDELLKPNNPNAKFDRYRGVKFSPEETLIRILRSWDKTMVFGSTYRTTSMKDNFIWLITTGTNRKIKKQEVNDILQNINYSADEKFFHIFYDIVFKNMDIPFYWNDRLSLSLIPSKFDGKKDFYEKYCEEESVRDFCEKQKSEVLAFLGYKPNEFEKLQNDAVLYMASKGNVVYILNGKFISLGTIKQFTKIMQGYSENYDISTICDMRNNMVSFLRKYKIVGSRKPIIALRDENNVRDSLSEVDLITCEDSVFAVVGLDKSAKPINDLNNLLTLIKEYTKVFNPTKVHIGENIVLDKNDFSSEIIGTIRSFFTLNYSSNYSENEYYYYLKGKSWLYKILIENNILYNFECGDKTLEEVVDLLDDPNLNKFFNLFSQNIMVNVAKNKQTDIGSYILDCIKYDNLSNLKSKYIDSYLTWKSGNKHGDVESSINKLIEKCDKKYNKFIND